MATKDAANTLVVSKHDNARHAAIAIPQPNAELQPSSVRVATKLISVTSNNLSYAKLGSFLHWWDTYPVPETAPSPYHEQVDWGIVPAWGYGEVVQSTIDDLEVGTTLWGYWPMSLLPVDLQLERTEPTGHWQETSGQRAKLMNIYNRYMEVEKGESTLDDATKGWSASLEPVFATGWQLHRYVFPELNATGISSDISFEREPQHPFGNGPPAWTAEDADLSSAVVVSLSAATKTGRGFAWQMLGNRDGKRGGPLGFLQVTSTPKSLWQGRSASPSTSVPTKTVTYDALVQPDTTAWIVNLKPRSLVVVDFGAPTSVIEQLVSLAKSTEHFDTALKFMLVGVGSEMRVMSGEELGQRQAFGQSLGRFQFNSGGVRERGIEMEGAEAYFKTLNESFASYLAEKGMGDLELSWGHGIEGDNSVSRAWIDVCQGKLSPQKAYVYKL